MEPEDAPYCIGCGARLEAAHRHCWRCGAPRWTPDRPPPGPRTGSFASRPQRTLVGLGLLPWFYAAGAIFFLVWTTQRLAEFLSPVGRAALAGALTEQGIAPSMQPAALIASGVVVIGAGLVAAGLHGAAFYGLQRRRRWGWLSAVVVAGLWSLLIVGIPVLLRLVDRNVRRAHGVD